MDTFNSSSALTVGVNAQLPLFNPASSPSFTLGEKEGEEILQTLHSIRDEVVHWEPNLFDIPLGAAGKRFLEENIRLISAFADGSALESASLLALMVLPALTLQRTADSLSHRQRAAHLDRRLGLSKDGNFEELLVEGRVLQSQRRLTR